MKKNINLIFIIIWAFLLMFNLNTQVQYSSNQSFGKSNQIENKSLNLENYAINPMYPNINTNVNQSTAESLADTGDWVGGGSTTDFKEFTYKINILDYSKSKEDFLKQYFKIEINFNHYHKWKLNRWVNEDGNSNKLNQKFEIDLNGNNITKDLSTNGYDKNQTATSSVDLTWSYTTIQLKFKMTTWVNRGGASSTRHRSWGTLQVKDFAITSKYNLEQFKTSIKNEGKKTISYKSFTGASIDSMDKLLASDFQGEWDDQTGDWKPGKEPKPSGKANKEEIEKLLLARAPTTFGDQWTAYKEYGVSYNLYNWNVIENTVDTVFTLNNKEFVRYTTKINLTVDQSYWDMSYLKRLEIIPGKIVDLNDISKTTNDVPELIEEDGKQTFIYHNTVTVNFASNSINKNEKLLVNGEDSEVWRDIFAATLTDGRNDETSTVEEDSTYEIAVEVDGEIKFSRTIQINSLNPNVDFKWMGWDPQNTPGDKNRYDQWVLTQPFINGEKNELYDPYIDPETGVRTQTIFVNEKPLNEPFLIDPKDRYGQLIGGDIGDDPSRWGYFAEAYVVNKGIKYLYDEEQLNEFSKIERVEIDPVTFEEIGSRKEIDIAKEVQFSNPGTWHYIFYLKDHVDQNTWGTNSINNPPLNKEIRATQGSVIHKIITLDSDPINYRRFLYLDASTKNSKIHEWFTVSPGGHLRSFMIANSIITSADALELIKYEQIVKYWKQYVSAAINGYMTYNPEIDDRFNLSDWQPIYFPMKQTEQEAAKAYITRKIKEQMFNFKGSAIDKDYVIESKQGHISLNDMDLSEFVSISEDNPVEELDLNVIATPESLLLVGNLEFQINNDISYDPDLEINLSDVNFENQEGNFTDWPDDYKKTFLENYILFYVEETLDQYRIFKNENLKQIPEYDENGKPTGNLIDKNIPEYKYGKDYAIYIDGMKLDVTKEPDIGEYISQFLNTSKKTVMWIRINAVKGTTLLSGATSYQITNDPKSNVVPPVKPDPGKPTPPDNGTGGETQNKSLFGGIWWLVTIPIIAIITITLFAVIKRKRKLRGYKLK